MLESGNAEKAAGKWRVPCSSSDAVVAKKVREMWWWRPTEKMETLELPPENGVYSVSKLKNSTLRLIN